MPVQRWETGEGHLCPEGRDGVSGGPTRCEWGDPNRSRKFGGTGREDMGTRTRRQRTNPPEVRSSESRDPQVRCTYESFVKVLQLSPLLPRILKTELDVLRGANDYFEIFVKVITPHFPLTSVDGYSRS